MKKLQNPLRIGLLFSMTASLLMLAPGEAPAQAQHLPLITANKGVSDGQFIYFMGGIQHPTEPRTAPGTDAVYEPGKTIIMDVSDPENPLFFIDPQELPWSSPRTFPMLAYDRLTDKIYLYGGNINGIPQNDLWSYDPAFRTWSSIVHTGMHPSPLKDAQIVEHEGAFSVLGGRYSNDNITRQDWMYDIPANAWNLLPQMPETGQFYRGAAAPYKKRGRLYFDGIGFDDVPAVYTQDPDDPDPSWRVRETAPEQAGGSMPESVANPYYGPTYPYIDPVTGETKWMNLWICGGYDKDGTYTTQHYELDWKSDRLTWKRRTPMPEPKINSATVYQNGHLWFYGGANTDYVHSNELAGYSETTQQWTTRNSGFAGVAPRERISAYLQDAWEIEIGGKRLALNIGVRYDSEDAAGYRVAKARGGQLKNGEIEWTLIRKLDAASEGFTDTLDLDGSTWLYKACAYNVAGNSEWSDIITVEAVSGIEKLPKGHFRVVSLYPNPSANRVRLEILLEEAGEIGLSLMDLSGRICLMQNYSFTTPGRQELTFETLALPGGVYLAEVKNDRKVETIKILLTR